MSGRKIFLFRIFTVFILALAIGVTINLWDKSNNGLSAGEIVLSGDNFYIVKGMFCYEETVVTAPYRGFVSQEIEACERVARGQAVASLEAAVTDLTDDNMLIAIKAKNSGLVYYELDGLEGIVTPERLETIPVPDIIKIADENRVFLSDGFYDNGEVICKIINNQKEPILCISLPTDIFTSEPEAGQTYSLTVKGISLQRQLSSCLTTGDSYTLLFTMPAEDKWFGDRIVPVVIDLEN